MPEVETIRLQLLPRLSGRRIMNAGSHPSAKFSSAVEAVGYRIAGVRRRGKYLIIELELECEPDDGTTARRRELAPEERGTTPRTDADDITARRRELIIHLGMTGRLSCGSDDDPGHPHLRAWWRLDDARVLAFHDIRRFGRVHVVRAGHYDGITTLNRLGPEPFSEQFTGHSLWRAVQASRRHLKTQLLSQRPVAGVGNIYADEALWLAGINPAVRRLSRARAETLASCIRAVLAAGLRHGGTTLRDYVTLLGEPGLHQHHLRCYGRSGEPCERCGANLRRRVIDARGTTWCPICQRR